MGFDEASKIVQVHQAERNGGTFGFVASFPGEASGGKIGHHLITHMHGVDDGIQDVRRAARLLFGLARAVNVVMLPDLLQCLAAQINGNPVAYVNHSFLEKVVSGLSPSEQSIQMFLGVMA
jgi:hypothetical protein